MAFYVIERKTQGVDRYTVEADSPSEALRIIETETEVSMNPESHEDLEWGPFELRQAYSG